MFASAEGSLSIHRTGQHTATGDKAQRHVGSQLTPTTKELELTLIDRIRHDIQERLEQLLAEADKLRHALAALDPRDKPKAKSARKAAARSVPAAPATPTPPAAKPSTPSSTAANATARARTAPGATKTKVLSALSADGGMTAGDVAKATGLARGTVSTTLSKLAKTGEVSKAERGYRLPTPS
jgi:DNA-binding transcriptional ArsR family regulator